MKRKKKTRPVPPLPLDAREDEVVEWLTTYDLEERVAAGVSEIVEDRSDLDQLLQEALFQDNTAQLSMHLPPAMKAVLTKLARQRTTDATTLARLWIAGRLQQELKAHG
jgi:hypothetical protein